MDARHEYLVIGAGAGGAMVSRELATRGKDVLLLERGHFETKVGDFWDCQRYYDCRHSMMAPVLVKAPIESKEGTVIWRTFAAGGSTLVAAGNGARCLESELRERGVDIGSELAEVEAETKVAPIDSSLLSEGSLAIRDAAQTLGYRFDLMPKFIDARLCKKCGNCVLGCKHGAKWTSARTVNQAKQAGAQVQYGSRVTEVVVEAGKVKGVHIVGPQGPQLLKADHVILAAGGITSPALLQRAGVKEAGGNFFLDLFVNVYGVTKGLNMTQEPSMALVNLEFHEERGFLMSPFVNHPRLVRFVESGPRTAMPDSKRLIGIMIKTRDDPAGRVYPDESVSKPVTLADRNRLDEGARLAKAILVKAGADPKSLQVSRVQGAHPGGGAALGSVVDSRLMTSIENLFVCDASVLPTTPGLPPIITIVALGKYLAKALAG
ncbi:MAG: GMC family oxidoreductase N-terminal domain-containing protein [Chloroflexota bacterium]